jgi:hypothetical protein
MPHPSSNHLISRVRDFIRWQEKMFGDPSSRGVPVEDPIGWANDKEFWILNSVWRETIFEGNADDSMAASRPSPDSSSSSRDTAVLLSAKPGVADSI